MSMKRKALWCVPVVLLLATAIGAATRAMRAAPVYTYPYGEIGPQSGFAEIFDDGQVKVYYSSWGSQRCIDLTAYMWKPPQGPTSLPEYVCVKKRETMSSFPVAVSPAFWATSPTILVAAVRVDGVTEIQRWEIDAVATGITTERTTLHALPVLTHLVALCVDPTESAVLGLHHESNTLLRVDLSTGAVSTVASVSTVPFIHQCWSLRLSQFVPTGAYAYILDRNITNTDAFRGIEDAADAFAFIWDVQLDGVADSVELVTEGEAQAAGYLNPANWIPN